MINAIAPYLHLTQILVFVTFIAVLAAYDPKNACHRLLLIILSVCALTEIISFIFIFNNIGIGLLYTVSLIIHNSLWLMILFRPFKQPSAAKAIIFSYLVFSLCNLFFLEGIADFNYYTFIIGAFLYLVIFIYKSFSELKIEHFSFFQSNDYLLLFAPVLFFFGLSFIFGFRSNALSSTLIFGRIRLYDFISCFVNIVYYSLIIFYIYREKKHKNAI